MWYVVCQTLCEIPNLVVDKVEAPFPVFPDLIWVYDEGDWAPYYTTWTEEDGFQLIEE